MVATNPDGNAAADEIERLAAIAAMPAQPSEALVEAVETLQSGLRMASKSPRGLRIRMLADTIRQALATITEAPERKEVDR